MMYSIVLMFGVLGCGCQRRPVPLPQVRVYILTMKLQVALLRFVDQMPLFFFFQSRVSVLAAGGKIMNTSSDEIQYLIREHMIENQAKAPIIPNNKTLPSDPVSFIEEDTSNINNRVVKSNEKLHVRWNSQRGRIFIDGSHLTHDLELGDEILIDNEAPTLKMFSIRHDD